MSEQITDLTGTTWVLNNVLDDDGTGEISVDLDGMQIYFNSNDLSFTYFNRLAFGEFEPPDDDWIQYANYLSYVSNINVSVYNNGVWQDPFNIPTPEAFKTISITGGTDATNSTLISWLQENATQIIEEEPISSFNELQVIDHTDYITLTIGENSINVVKAITPQINPYLTFSSPNSFTLNVVDNLKYWDGTLEYSTDTTNWTEWDGTDAISSGVSGNDNILYLRGTGNTYITGSDASSTKARWILTGINVSVSGNISRLLNYNGTTTVADSAFKVLFGGSSSVPNSALTNASNLTIDIMGTNICRNMFQLCSNLVYAPQLPATTLANYCYNGMFIQCTSLTSAPSLPATTLASYCYAGMFQNCSSLTTAPALPATTLDVYCYYQMFQGCTSLTSAPSLPATTLASYCYRQMFEDCTSLTSLPELSATTLTPYCYYRMFQNCSNIKLSTTQTGDYQTAYRIPTSVTGTTTTSALTNMFSNTGGTFKGTPTINTTYYTSNTIISAGDNN